MLRCLCSPPTLIASLFNSPHRISGLEELGLESGSPGRGPGGDSSSVSSLGRESSAPGSTKVGGGVGWGVTMRAIGLQLGVI